MLQISPHVIDMTVITAIVGLAAVLLRVVWKVTHFLDHLSAMLVLWEGTSTTPSVIDRLETVEREVSEIHRAVQPDHGSSAYDYQTALINKIIDILRENHE